MVLSMCARQYKGCVVISYVVSTHTSYGSVYRIATTDYFISDINAIIMFDVIDAYYDTSHLLIVNVLIIRVS